MLAGAKLWDKLFFSSVPSLTFTLLEKKEKKKNVYVALCFYQIFVLTRKKSNNNMDWYFSRYTACVL